MTDPAVDAALRAIDGDCSLETAAREALAPIRALHKPMPCCPDNACDMLLCSTCNEPEDRRLPVCWPCPTARLIYTTTELENPDD